MSYPYIQSNSHYVIGHFLLSSLGEVKFDLYKQLQQKGINLILGKKICSNFFTKLRSMINAKVGDITFDDIDDGTNNKDMVAIEHEILVESEKKRQLLTVLLCWGYHQLRFMENHSAAEKVLVKEKQIL